MEMLETGELKGLVDSVYFFEDVLKAFKILAEGKASGKVFLKFQ